MKLFLNATVNDSYVNVIVNAKPIRRLHPVEVQNVCLVQTIIKHKTSW